MEGMPYSKVDDSWLTLKGVEYLSVDNDIGLRCVLQMAHRCGVADGTRDNFRHRHNI